MISREGCCADQRKPCSYHEGVADAFDSLRPREPQEVTSPQRVWMVVEVPKWWAGGETPATAAGKLIGEFGLPAKLVEAEWA